MKYPVYIKKDLVTLDFLAVVPDLPGCTNTSDSFDAAFDKIQEAIKSHLSILAEYGEAIPNGLSVDSHRIKLSTEEPNLNLTDIVWALINIDITPYLGKSHKINVTLPELLITQIDDRVNKSSSYKTRSGFIASACLTELAR